MWSWHGRVRHADAVAEMEARRARVLAGEQAEAILLCEHEPVITLGKSAEAANVLVARAELERRGVDLSPASRGGDVTYHGPGQLMVYPVVRLARGVVWHLAAIAGVLAEVAAEVGVAGAEFRREPAGLWLGDRKLAACGIHVRRGVAIHGYALDVATPPEIWRLIVPCGLRAAAPISIERALEGSGRPVPTVKEVAERVGPRLADVILSVPPGTLKPSAPPNDISAASSWSTTPTTTRS